MKHGEKNTRKEPRKPHTGKARRSAKSSRHKPKKNLVGTLRRTRRGTSQPNGRRPSNSEDAEARSREDDVRGRSSETADAGSTEGQRGSIQGNGGQNGGQSAPENRDQHGTEDGSDSEDHPRTEETRHVEYVVKLPVYHAKQDIFIHSTLKRKIVRAGRRGGKTTGAAGLAVESLVELHKRVLYAVPTGDQISRFWHEIIQALAEPLEYGLLKKYESDKIIEYPGTEQRIRAKTAWNADTLRGDYGDVIILDEYQLMNEDALDKVVYPMLIDNNGDLVLIYTPPSLHSRSTSKATDKRHAAKMFKARLNDTRWLCLHFTSRDNPYISEEGIEEVSRDMTAIAIRQEIEAEDIDEVPGALWSMKIIEDNRVAVVPDAALPFTRIVVGVDPSGSSTTEAGIVCAALGRNNHGYILDDKSLFAPTPRAWGQEAVWLYHQRNADRVLGERNYGGDMIRQLIREVDPNVSYKDVTATRSKLVRAEPCAALYEKGVIHHVGTFANLEEEQCSYVPGISKSPNRMDALVWALTELFPLNVRLTLAEQQNEAQDSQVKAQQSKLIKPATNEKTGVCPECGSKAINKRGPLWHCAQCAHEWGNAPVPAATGGRTGL